MTSLANSFDQSGHPVARFNGDLFYRIEGDRAELSAELAILDQQSFDRQQCLLQLWACPSASGGDTSDGIKVAERRVSGEDFTVSAETLALPPAGRDDYVMVMTLVGIGENGAMQLHDYANFDYPQGFTQPQLQGTLNCDFGGDHVDLTVECIRNPRAADNLSGSLSLELWALAEPYRGGAFSGLRLASTELGVLGGGEEWLHNSFRLDLAPLPNGECSLVLMLREWTAAGYLTRDYRVLQSPARADVIEPTPVAEAVEATAVVEIADEAPVAEVVEVAEQAEVAEAVAAETEAAVVETAEVPEAVEVSEASPATEADDEVAEAAEEVADAVAEKTAAPVKETEKPGLVSVNEASAAELVKVKGISPRLASAIVAGRPYDSIDDLLQVRGIGQRSLDRLRSSLEL